MVAYPDAPHEHLNHQKMYIHFRAFKAPSSSRASCRNRCVIPVPTSRHVCHATQTHDRTRDSMDRVASAAMAIGSAFVILHSSDAAKADVEV